MAVPQRQEFILETLDAAFKAANRAKLDPTWTMQHDEVLLDCPQCKQDGLKARANIRIPPFAGGLVAQCKGCQDDIAPGIIGLLEIIGRPPGDLIPLHPERNGNNATPDPNLLAWIPLDLVTLGDKPRMPPAISGLIYPGRRHILTGESESGKTWMAIGVAADELKLGNGVIWADLDFMGAQDILERLRQFGVPDEAITELFAFYQPDGALEGHSLDAVLNLIQNTNARYVVLDAFTGLCHLHKLNPNDGIDIERAYRCIQPLCDTGAGVTILDHVVKAAENRGRYASGSERKLSGADVAIGFQLIEHYGRGKTGRSKLTIHKDRPAMLTRPVAGIFTLRSDPDTHNVTWRLEADTSKTEDGAFRPTGYMEKVSRYLEKQFSPVSRSEVISIVGGKAAHVRTAMDLLVIEGYVLGESGPRNSQMLTSLQAFREEED